MRVKFEKQLNELKGEMINMSTMVEEAISNSIKVLLKNDTSLAEDVKSADKNVDHQQKKIENLCFNILLQQQPVANDLKAITAAMNMITDIERIGDHAADICDMVIHMKGDNLINEFPHIVKMASEALVMLNDSVKAYVDKNVQRAGEIIVHDDVVDELFYKSKKDILDLIKESTDINESVLDLLMVAKYFERIADHSTNIAEWVIYAFDSNIE